MSVWSSVSLGLDGYGLAERPHLQPDVHAGDGVHRDRDVLLHMLLEPGQGHAHRVGPGHQVDETVGSIAVRRGFAREVGLLVDDRHRRARHRSLAGVGHAAHDAAIENLRLSSPGRNQKHGRQDRDLRKARRSATAGRERHTPFVPPRGSPRRPGRRG